MPLVPPFDPLHFYAEQVILLRTEHGVYGRIVCEDPTALDGGPDMEGSRPPLFTGHITLTGSTHDGKPVQMPIQFRILTGDPLIAVREFARLAQEAVEQIQSESLRKQILNG